MGKKSKKKSDKTFISGLKYCGELKNNKANGKGILYFKNGNIEYDGEFKDHKRKGKGIGYYPNGNKIYEGEWKDNLPNGHGIGYHTNGNKKYDGALKYNYYNGKGTLYDENGNKEYEGELKDFKFNGKGISYYENGSKEYEGEWEHGYRKFKILEEVISLESVDTCCICMESKCNIITKCEHTFCYDCILEHFKNNHKCPMCRQVLNSINYINNTNKRRKTT